MCNRRIFVGWMFRVEIDIFVYISSLVGIKYRFRVQPKKPSQKFRISALCNIGIVMQGASMENL